MSNVAPDTVNEWTIVPGGVKLSSPASPSLSAATRSARWFSSSGGGGGGGGSHLANRPTTSSGCKKRGSVRNERHGGLSNEVLRKKQGASKTCCTAFYRRLGRAAANWAVVLKIKVRPERSRRVVQLQVASIDFNWENTKKRQAENSSAM